MNTETIFDDLRLLGFSGLTYQTSDVPVFALDGMDAGTDVATSNIFTVDTLALLTAKPTLTLVSGSVTAYVRENNGQYRLDGTFGAPDGINILASDNGALQWFKV